MKKFNVMKLLGLLVTLLPTIMQVVEQVQEAYPKPEPTPQPEAGTSGVISAARPNSGIPGKRV